MRAQAIGLPICPTLTYFLGAVMVASSQVTHSEVIGNPLKVVQIWNNRATKPIGGLLLAAVNVGAAVAVNSFPARHDFMAL